MVPGIKILGHAAGTRAEAGRIIMQAENWCWA